MQFLLLVLVAVAGDLSLSSSNLPVSFVAETPLHSVTPEVGVTVRSTDHI